MQEALALLDRPGAGQASAHERCQVLDREDVQTQRLIATHRQLAAVRTEGDAVNPLARLRSGECQELATGAGVPQPGGAVAAAGGNALPIRAEHGGHHRPGVAAEDKERIAAGGIPGSGGPVLAGGYEATTVRAECDAPDCAQPATRHA